MNVGRTGNKLQEAATFYCGVPYIKISKERGQADRNGGLDDALKLNKKGRVGAARSWWRVKDNGDRVSVWHGEKFLEMDSGDSCTTI